MVAAFAARRSHTALGHGYGGYGAGKPSGGQQVRSSLGGVTLSSGSASLAWSGWSLTCMPRDVALRVLAATSKSAHVFGASCRILSGWAGHFIATNPNSNRCLTGGRGRSGFWTGTADISPAVPFLSVRIGMPGVCSAGCVGGQATQPRSTHTPSPSVQLGGVGWAPHCHARGRR